MKYKRINLDNYVYIINYYFKILFYIVKLYTFNIHLSYIFLLKSKYNYIFY